MNPKHKSEIVRMQNVEAVILDRLVSDEKEKVSDSSLETAPSNLGLKQKDLDQNGFGNTDSSELAATTDPSNVMDSRYRDAKELDSSSTASNQEELENPILNTRDILPRNSMSWRDSETFQGGSELEKRDGGVIYEKSATRHLAFISTPAGARSQDYLYPAGPYEQITLYTIDRGVEAQHNEFTTNWIIKKYIYDTDLPSDEQRQTDDYVDNGNRGHGTCALSVACGHRFGVFKHPNVVVIKISKWLGSALAGYRTVLNELAERTKVPQQGPVKGPIKGYTVLSLQQLLQTDEKSVSKRITQAIELLTNAYEVVVTSPSGNDADIHGPVSDYPSVLSRKYPLIVVGAVDLFNGERSVYSQKGKFVTVHAPGTVQCAASGSKTDTVINQGTSFAASLTAGVATLLLADKKLGTLLRSNPLGVVEAVKACIVELAQRRGKGNFPSIWTGMDFRKKDDNYGWPPLSLECLRGGKVSFEDTGEESEPDAR